jgi:hypothetical protein
LAHRGTRTIVLNWPHFTGGGNDGDARLAMALIDPMESPPVHEKHVVFVRNSSMDRSRQPPILSLVSLYPIDFFPKPNPLSLILWYYQFFCFQIGCTYQKLPKNRLPGGQSNLSIVRLAATLCRPINGMIHVLLVYCSEIFFTRNTSQVTPSPVNVSFQSKEALLLDLMMHPLHGHRAPFRSSPST